MTRRVRRLLAWFEQLDGWLMFAVLALSIIGVVMVYNAGSFNSSSSTYYLVHQIIRFGLGLGALWFLAGVDYQTLRRPWLNWGLLGIGLGLVLVTVVLRETGFVDERAGSSRWLPFVQPVEIVKIALVLFLAQQCAGGFDRLRRDDRRFWTALAVPAVAMVALALQPNYGNAAMMGFLTIVLLTLSGLPLRVLVGLGAGGVAVAALGFLTVAKINHRLVLWWLAIRDGTIDPSADAKLYQVYQSLLGLGAGGWHGTGIGASQQRFAFLPDSHTDFIFSVVGEELGLVGGVVTLFLFVLLGWRGYNIARNAGDEFGCLVAAGLTTMLLAYAAINIGMVTAVLPVMGLPLPFISYGGSALITNLAAVGILLSIDRQGRALRARRVRVIGRP
jgi:cell division protein FtsW